MNAKHTPGPWELTADPCHYDTLTSIRGGPAEIRGRGIKWRQMMIEVGGYADPATAEANARLIAAAPEMLAALRHVTRLLGMWKEDPECTCEDCVMLRPVYAAITKALGPDWQNSKDSLPELGELS